MNVLEACLEEIALEGLDGITIPSLWVRLTTRKDSFPLELDDAAKQFLWKYLIKDPQLCFYELQDPRPPLVLYDRFSYTDPETSICVEKEDLPEDIYPVKIIRDGNIVGSCSSYYTRTNITSHISRENLTVHQAFQKWGEKLVIVASQEMRIRAICGPDVFTGIEVADKLYCILERIGRKRWQGEVTLGKDSLNVFQEASKTIFYYRKVMRRYNLITEQPFNLRLSSGNNSSGKLIHLKRFFVERRPIYQVWLERLTRLLNEKPQKTEILSVIRGECGLKEKVFKKLYQLGHRYVEVENVLYRDLFPEASEEQYMVKNKDHERFVRVLRLKKLYVYKYVTGAANDDDDTDDNEDSDEENFAGNVLEGRFNRIVEESLLRQAYSFIRLHAEKGVSHHQVGAAFNLKKLEGRLLCRNLERLNLVTTKLTDVGKQKVQIFVATDFLMQCDEHKKFHKLKTNIISKSDEALKNEEASDSDDLTPKKKKVPTATLR